MANLAPTNLDGGQSPFRPVAPAVDQSGGVLMNALGSMVSTGIKGLIAKDELETETANAGYVQGFREEQLLVADAVDQGIMTSQQGLSRMRQNYLKYTSGNPVLAGEVQKVYDDIITTAGLGKAVAEGTPEEQAFAKVKADTIAAGWIRDGDSPAQQDAAIKLYLDDKQYRDQLARLQAEASYDSTQLGLTSSQLSIENTRRQRQSQQALSSLASTQTPRFRMEMNRIIEDFRLGRITQEEALTLAQDQNITLETFLTQVGSDAGGDYINNLAKPMKSIYDNTVSMINGDITLESLTRQNDLALATATAGWLSDPDRAAVVAGSRLFPNSDVISMSVRTMPSIVGYLEGFSGDRPTSSPFPLTDGDKTAFREFTTNMLKPNINLYLNGALDEQATAELDRTVSNMITSIPAYSGSASSLSDYQPLVDFLADPTTFGRYAEKRGGIPSDAVAQAEAVLGEQYERKVVDLIQNEWKAAQASLATITPTGRPNELIGRMEVTTKGVPEVIEPVFSGGGVVFRVKNGVESNVEYNRIIRNLNSRVSPALNKLLHLGAHFNGTRDYKAEYDANYADIFGAPEGSSEE